MATQPMSETPNTNEFKSKDGLKRIFNAMRYSIEGLGSSLKHEAAFRQELILCLLLVPAAVLLPLSLLAKALLVASLFLVLIVELLNSAIEWTIDYISMDAHPFAKRVKDMASAAVFLSLTHLFIIWGMVLTHAWQDGAFEGIF